MNEKYQLTPVEFELMEILWKIKQGTVRDVMAYLSSDRKLAYTSVSTILRILEQKKIVTTQKTARQHLYLPAISKQVFATYSVKKMVKQIFSGNPVELVSYLISKEDISSDEIIAIQKVLDAKKKKVVS